MDSRFCPVIFMMLWLRASGIKKGPIFPKIRLTGGVGTIKSVVVPFILKSFQFEQKTMDQWVNEKDSLVHMSYDNFASSFQFNSQKLRQTRLQTRHTIFLQTIGLCLEVRYFLFCLFKIYFLLIFFFFILIVLFTF